jgi:23S rRNA pseudouridine2605 synthase
MRRNNKDNPGFRKPDGKGANNPSSPREERQERDQKPSSGRFFKEKKEGSAGSGRSTPRKPAADWGNKPDRKSNPISGKYGRRTGEGKPHADKGTFNKFSYDKRERPEPGSKPAYKKFGSEKTFGGRPSSYKPGPDRRERPEDDRKTAGKNFGREWKEKPGNIKPTPETKERSASSRKPGLKKDWGEKTRDEAPRYGKSNWDKGGQSESSVKKNAGGMPEREEGASYKTVYKGRGKDQKPRYETVKREDSETKRPGKKFFGKSHITDNGPSESKPSYDFKKFEKKDPNKAVEVEIRLNKYIANAGVCSRREADALIENGLISVNGEIVKELGHKVLKKDNVEYQGKRLNPEKPVYVLLNKPKDFITTTDDPMERKTVMSLVSGACEERIFPVGRLDRNTTGLLLFTNDGDLADKLASPANNIKKIYQVTLDTGISKKDLETILEGITLEDGPVKVDDLQVLSKDRTILGLEIHIGKNRIVRRIFAHLGYEVVSLDRVVYAGLTKKDLSRGNYRFLSEKEVINLKYFS